MVHLFPLYCVSTNDVKLAVAVIAREVTKQESRKWFIFMFPSFWGMGWAGREDRGLACGVSVELAIDLCIYLIEEEDTDGVETMRQTGPKPGDDSRETNKIICGAKG